MVITTWLLQQGCYGLMALLKSVTIKPSVISVKLVHKSFLIIYICFEIKLKHISL